MSDTVLSRYVTDSYGSSLLFNADGTEYTGSFPLDDPYTGFGAQFGYYRDNETGLILCIFRYYDPNTGC